MSVRFSSIRGGAAFRAVPASEPCDICGGPTIELKCKIICKNCGFTRDCSDP